MPDDAGSDDPLRRAEDLERFWSLSPDLFLITTTGGVWLRANASLERILGWSIADIAREGSRNIMHPDDRDRTSAESRKLAQGQPVQRFENRVRHKDGSYRYLAWTAVHADGIVYAIARDFTLRKAAELEAEVKAAQLKVTLENMDQGLMMFDRQEVIQVFNPRAAELLGIPDWFLAQSPSFRQLLRYQIDTSEFVKSDAQFRRWVAESGVSDRNDTYERERPDGTVLEIRTVPLQGGGAVRTYTDITARRRAEADLRASEERYRALVSASASILWRAAPDGAIIHALGWSEYTGLPEQSYSGDGWLDAVLPADRAQARAAWREALGSGRPLDIRYRVRRRDGAFRWMVARAVPMHHGDDLIREWVGTLTDIHEHRLASEAVALSEARYRLLAENATDMIERTDLAGWCQYISPACRDILGYEAEALIGTNLARLSHPDDRATVSARFDDLAAGRAENVTAVFRARHRDGRWVWLEARRRLVRGESGRPSEVTSVVRDITERALLEDRLRQSQKMEAIGQLTGGIAHDFNNLLTVVIGNSEILADDIADPELKFLARMTLEAAERGAALNQQLLTFARRQALKPEPVSLPAVVQGMMSMLRRTLGEHIEIVTTADDSRSAALTDRTMLESAILNLVVNARDAMPGGGVLTIGTGEAAADARAGAIPAGHAVVCVTVSDTGTGMSAEVLEHAFEPFFTTKEVGKGSGLGLSMVYGFAEQSGGHVSIASEPGRGTEVTLFLPAVSPAGRSAAAASARSAERGRARVLLVEDEASVREFARSQLVSLGYDVAAAATGPAALLILREDRAFDLLFSDVVLPQGMSGVELARHARTLMPALKVVLTSGYPEEAFEHHGRPDADVPLLRKPYRRKELAQTLRRVLEPD